MTEHTGRRGHVIGPHRADDVYVVAASDVERLRHWHVAARVVIDIRRQGVPALPLMAQIVLLRRRLRGAGGDLVAAADPQAARVLRSTGLHWVIPCGNDLSGALSAIREPDQAVSGSGSPV